MKKKLFNNLTYKVWLRILPRVRRTKIYHFFYRSYWHYLFHNSNKNNDNNYEQTYYSARPNPGAGIGHQIANWISGYWYANYFDLKYVHIPFPSSNWDAFLGFGNKETQFKDLLKEGYLIRRLPLFDEYNKQEVDLNKKIISSYKGRKIVFIAEQDQGYYEQSNLIDILKEKFYSSKSRMNDKVIYSKDNFNIAIHVRRGDIMVNQSNPNLFMRYLSNDYYEKVLKGVVNNIITSKPIHIYFFSQGNPSDYPEFSIYKNIHWCMDMNAQESFLHFVYSDLLITSKSSFSYKPALLNNGIKICPKNFWHSYPESQDWILCDDKGNFDVDLLKNIKE